MQDSDRISFVLASRQGETIRHLLPLDHLLILTDHTEYRVTPINNDAITPTSLAVRPQSFIGSSYVKPLVVGRTVLFNAARGGHVFEMGYQAAVEGFTPGDVSLRATHFFDELTIKDAALQKAPYQISWWTSSNGSLLGFTYVPEQQIGGWHEHTTDGTFESVCVVPEGDEDRVYAVVLRNGTRAIERMGAMKHDSLEDGVFVDSAVVYDGVPTKTITGLTHLNGQSVLVLADGVVLSATVALGSITLPSHASKVVVGLPYTSRLTTLPLLLQVDGYGQGRTKNVNHVHVRVQESGVFDVGPLGGTLRPSNSKANAVRGNLIADPVVTDSVRVTISGGWEDDGAVTVEQSRPLPLNVLGMTLEVELGG